MDTKLQRLVSDYQTVVSRRFTQLRTELGFAAPESDVAWACNDLEQKGRLSDGAQYFKHGYGCAIKGATDSVDFDFGENGEIDGFAASSLWEFAVASKKITASRPKKRSRLQSHGRQLKVHSDSLALYFITCRRKRLTSRQSHRAPRAAHLERYAGRAKNSGRAKTLNSETRRRKLGVSVHNRTHSFI